MAVFLAGDVNGRISLGDVAAVSGITALTVAFRILPTVTPSAKRLTHQWGGATGSQAFLVTVEDNDEIGLVLSSGGGSYFGKKTNDINLQRGTWNNIVCTWAPGTPNTITINVNGREGTLANHIDTTDLTAVINSGTNVELGHESDEAEDGLDGIYCDWYGFSRVWSADEKAAFAAFGDPATFSTTGRLWGLRLFGPGDLGVQFGTVTATATGATAAAHPGQDDGDLGLAHRRKRRSR